MKLVPILLFGTAMYAPSLWVTGAPSATFDTIKKELESSKKIHVKDDNVKVLKTVTPDYLKRLRFVASWIIGDHYGEDSIIQSLKISTDDTLIDQMKNVLDVLKRGGKIYQPNLAEAIQKIEDGIKIDEILEILAEEKIPNQTKTKAFKGLTEIFNYNINVVNGNILIPVLWRDNTQGGLLVSMEPNFLKVFDTKSKYYTNAKKPGDSNPLDIETCTPYTKDVNGFFTMEGMVIALANLKNEKVLNAYKLTNEDLGKWMMASFVEWMLKLKGNIGKVYFEKVILNYFGDKSSNMVCRLYPYVLPVGGHVQDILNYLRNIGMSKEEFKFQKLVMDVSVLNRFMKKYGSDSGIIFDTRNRAAVSEILKRCADRIIKEAFLCAKEQNWIDKNNKITPPYIRGRKEDEFKVQIFTQALKSRNQVYNWIESNRQDQRNLRKLNRSLDQREKPLSQNPFYNLSGAISNSINLLNFMPRQSPIPDYSNCMAVSNAKIANIQEFIRVFDFVKKVYYMFELKYKMKMAHCESFARRNAELLLRSLDLGGLDEKSLKRWTPTSRKQYSNFKASIQSIFDVIVSLPNGERTLEDYIILLRLQRIYWRVTQALDLSFAKKEPTRHLDLIKYSLSFPQCEQLLKDQMDLSNFFLADSGYYGNILNLSSMKELKSLCKELLDEQNSSKSVLNSKKYFRLPLSFIDIYNVKYFDSLDDGDREIYYKMSQNPKISSLVRDNHEQYSVGMKTVTQNAARVCSQGKAGSQFIYYHFFDAAKMIFSMTKGIKTQLNTLEVFPATFLSYGEWSVLVLLPKGAPQTISISAVNAESVKTDKSYVKILVSEMFQSRMLGLDVIVNHLGRASAKLWGSSVTDSKLKAKGVLTGIEFIDNIYLGIEGLIKEISRLMETFARTGTEALRIHLDLNPLFEFSVNLAVDNETETDGTEGNWTEAKAFRNTIAGNADFFINCSAQMRRKLDVAPEYEKLVMSMLMKTITSVSQDLDTLLKKLEKLGGKSGAAVDTGTSGGDEESEYLKKGFVTPDEYLTSLINWSVIALRFTERVRGHKQEWKNRFSTTPSAIYSIISKYSKLSAANDEKMTSFDMKLIAHADYVIFMTISMFPNDKYLRQRVFEVLNQSMKDTSTTLKTSNDLMGAAMVFHRFLALSEYNDGSDGPITIDFISNQYGIAQVMKFITTLDKYNGTYLKLMALHMSQYLSMSPADILEKYSHTSNLTKGVLIYEAFAINVIVGSFTQNGLKPINPNKVLKFSLFKQFFSAGGYDGVKVSLGKPTHGCNIRYEVKDYLLEGANYSICEDEKGKEIGIYRQIPKFKQPCELVMDKTFIERIQEAFSVFTNDGIDIYQCRRGNNYNYVWLGRNSVAPIYVSHGKINLLSTYTVKLNELLDPQLVHQLLKSKIHQNFDFETKLNTDPKNQDDGWFNSLEKLFSLTLSLPRLSILEYFGEQSFFPITNKSKVVVVPEPFIRFSGGSVFGTYTQGKSLVFMFQQFRFRENPKVSLTFIENPTTGALEMYGRQDLKACDDQVFENDFWPALMVEKRSDDDKGEEEARFALVPITNPESIKRKVINQKISVEFDETSSDKFSVAKNSNIIFLESVAVEKLAATDMKTVNGKAIHVYRLKPSSRIQRILLAYHFLKLRNYSESFKLLDFKGELDHNTKFSIDEVTILDWMVRLNNASEPEGLAIRLIAKIHLVLDKEIFIDEYRKPVQGESKGVIVKVKNDRELVQLYSSMNAKQFLAHEHLNDIFPQPRSSLSNINSIPEFLNNEKSTSNLGLYFNYLKYIPDHFLVENAFKEVMPSIKIRTELTAFYNTFSIPQPIPIDTTSFKYENSECNYKTYISEEHLLEPILEPLSSNEEQILQGFITGRYSINYEKKNCDLPRIMLQRVIQIHGEDQNFGRDHELPKELVELIKLYFYLSRQKFTNLDKYLYKLGHPSADIDEEGYSSYRPLNYPYYLKIRNYINLAEMKKEFGFTTIQVQQFGSTIIKEKRVDNPKIIVKFLNDVIIRNIKKFAHKEKNFNIFNQIKEMNEHDPKGSWITQELSNLLDPMRCYDSEIRNREKTNTLRFESKDFHFISKKERALYNEAKEKIKTARTTKAEGDSDDTDNLKIARIMKKVSRTQSALEVAIEDYLKDRNEPVGFEKIIEGENDEPFKKLSGHIKARLKELKVVTEGIKKRYDQYYSSLKLYDDKTYRIISVLSSLNRVFNSFGNPKLEDLRDCLMTMSYSCIQKRLPELKKRSIVRIVRFLKDFYLHKIVSYQLKSLGLKIEGFNSNVAKVKEYEALKPTLLNDKERADLDEKIFGEKDSAISTIDDIYNDLDKLLLIEVRLTDPVTLNFEFMSEKFHLTKIQVQDIASLSSRHWEDSFKTQVFELLRGSRANFPIKVKAVCDKLNYLAKKLGINDPKEIEELWAYMPRNIDRDVNYQNINRQSYALQVLGQRIGQLKPYDAEADSYVSRVIQRKMAAGKTTVLGTAATVKKADGKTLSVLVILSALYQSSAPDMQKRTSGFFKSTGVSFFMPEPRISVPSPRDINHPAKSFLTWTLKTLVRTINTNSYLIVSPETLQSFLNSYVEFMDAFVNTPNGRFNPELSQCLHLFASIYNIFRSRGSIILDEIDSIMKPQKELNFPTTKRENILSEGVILTGDLIFYSAFDEEIKKAGLKLLDNQQAALNQDQFEEVRDLWRDYILEKIDDKESPWHDLILECQNFHVTSSQLVKFIFNTKETQDDIDFMKNARGCDKRKFHTLMVIKMQIKNWMSSCLKSSVNEHYGPSSNSKTGSKPIYFAIPYMAANTPSEGSIFADRWETVNKTFMMYLVKTLSLADASLILFDLRDLASGSDEGLTSAIRDHFKEACDGSDFFNLKFNHLNQVIDKSGNIVKCMNSKSEDSLQLIFLWIVKFIFEKEEFYAEQITSNAINLTTMFPSVQGYSGTIDNVNVLPHQVMVEAEKDHKLNEKANGAIAWKLLQQNDCVSTVDNIETYKHEEGLIDAMIKDQKDHLAEYSAFVDVGALLKDFTNKQVAIALANIFKRNIIIYYNEKTNQLTSFNKNDASHIALEGSETKYLNKATNSEVKDRFTYYDQRHITGSDILQPPTAKAFLTIGPKVLLRDILQGVMRMRQFQSGQSIHFITTSSVETLLSKACQNISDDVQVKESRRMPRVSTKHLLALGALNEDEKQMMENLRLYRTKIDAEIRAFVLDILTEALIKEDPYNSRAEKSWYYDPNISFGHAHEELFAKTRSIFIRNVSENPLNWATVTKKKYAYQVVHEYLTSRLKLIPEDWKNGPRWNQLNANLDVLVSKCNQDDKEDGYMDNSEGANEGLDAKCQETNPRTLLAYVNKVIEISEIPKEIADQTGSEGTEQGSTVEMELQLELQQEIKVELNQIIPNDDRIDWQPEPVITLSTCKHRNFLDPETYEELTKNSNLLAPWDLYNIYKENEYIPAILKHDLLCPNLNLQDYNENDIRKYCTTSGYVGISKGILNVKKMQNSLDMMNMSAREATHLLFYRVNSVNDDSAARFAVYLIAGHEAISLYKDWKQSSYYFKENEEFWLTDLYGYEIHGSPFSKTKMHSSKYSFLEHEYQDFAELHFRALALNGSYNVIISSKLMFTKMRKWIGDTSLLVEGEQAISQEDSIERIKLFIARMSALTKLRSEIDPSDPFISFMIKIISKHEVEFTKLDNMFTEEHAYHESTSDSQTIWNEGSNVSLTNTDDWTTPEDINVKVTDYFYLKMIMSLISISAIGALSYYYGIFRPKKDLDSTVTDKSIEIVDNSTTSFSTAEDAINEVVE